MEYFPSIGVQIPEILLPKQGIDLARWAVIACDQYTSQPNYWDQVAEFVGSAPSTLKLVLPEVYLEAGDIKSRVHQIQKEMSAYLAAGLFEPGEYMVLTERSVGGKTRRGILLALDLEHYDYSKGSSSLIRATEGTIIERLPPRIKIREGAPLELPHILVLIDDPLRTVIEPAALAVGNQKPSYDFELMFGSGHLRGFAIQTPEIEQRIIQALHQLAEPTVFGEKYGVPTGTPPLLFAMGDGNHSLATAKAIWEKIKATAGENHPARFALVEIENVHDEGLNFEPIHRVLFNLHKDPLSAAREHFGKRLSIKPCSNPQEMIRRVDKSRGQNQRIGYTSAAGSGILEFIEPEANLPVGTLQPFLDQFLAARNAQKIDYVHGGEVTIQLGNQPGNFGFYLPVMAKSDLFKTVILDGALPRKTFSMGAAREKRFYLEARRIA